MSDAAHATLGVAGSKKGCRKGLQEEVTGRGLQEQGYGKGVAGKGLQEQGLREGVAGRKTRQ